MVAPPENLPTLNVSVAEDSSDSGYVSAIAAVSITLGKMWGAGGFDVLADVISQIFAAPRVSFLYLRAYVGIQYI